MMRLSESVQEFDSIDNVKHKMTNVSLITTFDVEAVLEVKKRT